MRFVLAIMFGFGAWLIADGVYHAESIDRFFAYVLGCILAYAMTSKEAAN